MQLFELLLIAVGLSMDAFAVSICKGLSAVQLRRSQMLLTGLYFGGFQALMPVVGYLLAAQFADRITAYSGWIAFALLALIGGNMIKEALQKKEETQNGGFSPRSMLPLAVATSIDALAVGVSFALLSVRIAPAAALIGAVTFVCSVLGVHIGHLFGAKYEKRAELAGGIILIAMGAKILLEHLLAG